MSVIDKLAAKIMPPESAEDRAEARRNAQQLAAESDGWLAVVLDHHRRIEQAFAKALNAPDGPGRRAACKELGVILTGHANAEESVLYPALADCGEKGHTAMAYEEQAMTKVEMALLEKLEPMSAEWREKLEHIQGAVQHHMYEEEGIWFPELERKVPQTDRAMLNRRFVEEFERYCGGGQAQMPPMQMAADTAAERSPSAPDDR